MAYQWLQQLVKDYRAIVTVAFSHAAANEFQRLRKVYPRIGKMDLKIAAISLPNNAILLARNSSDFKQIGELQTSDWSVA